MSIGADNLREIVRNIWETQLALELEDCDQTQTQLFAEIRDRIVTASIQISGAWRGAVHLHCSRDLVRRVASLMFRTPPEHLTIDDFRDAVGELTNMTAGNVKALLPGESFISLPIVVEGTDYDVTLIDGEIEVEVSFLLDGEPMSVVVLRRRQPN